LPRTPRPQLPADDLTGVPLDDSPARRTRLRRGGPRTPLPLLPLIAALAGVGVAYVSQSAHSTQATYQAAGLAEQNQQLRAQDAELGDELARLESAERIVAAAQKLGMRPAGHWSYVNVPLKPALNIAGPPPSAQPASGDPLQQFVASVGGAFGMHSTDARTGP
jgi:cell division protein FtsL